MAEPLYKRGDMVEIASEPWNQYSGEIVLIEEAFALENGNWRYDFVIPEQRGSAPESLILRRVAAGFTLPERK